MSARAGTACVVVSALLSACAAEQPAPRGDSSAATIAAAATPQKTKGDAPMSSPIVTWAPLIDARLSQWRAWKQDSLPTGWRVENDVLVKDDRVGDLQSRMQYANFELEFDWKVSDAGNAGVFYRVTEEYEKPYWSGPEYQLLDDAKHPDATIPERAAASAYGLYAPPRGVTKPANAWNSARIVVAGNFVEHWLNGQQVVQYQLNSPDWSAKVKAAKFKDYPHYGTAARGFIAIQGDHEGQLSIRGMRIRDLP
jgi:hypothetical protein